MKKYIFYYNMSDNIKAIGGTAKAHKQYWQSIKENGGPFSDFKGGFVSFLANNHSEAISKIQKDPFFKNDLFKKYWLNEWL